VSPGESNRIYAKQLLKNAVNSSLSSIIAVWQSIRKFCVKPTSLSLQHHCEPNSVRPTCTRLP